MGTFLKIIGFFLLIVGVYGLIVTIPELILNLTLDNLNPLIMLGIIESGTRATVFDLMLSAILVIVGIVFLKKPDTPKIRR